MGAGHQAAEKVRSDAGACVVDGCDRRPSRELRILMRCEETDGTADYRSYGVCAEHLDDDT